MEEEDVDTYMSFYGLNNICKRYIGFLNKDDYLDKDILLNLIKLYPFCIDFVFNLCTREQEESDDDNYNKILYKELCENYNVLKIGFRYIKFSKRKFYILFKLYMQMIVMEISTGREAMWKVYIT